MDAGLDLWTSPALPSYCQSLERVEIWEEIKGIDLYIHFLAPSLPSKSPATGAQRGTKTYSKASSKNDGFLLEICLPTTSLTSCRP